jgi:hypothetical protein
MLAMRHFQPEHHRRAVRIGGDERLHQDRDLPRAVFLSQQQKAMFARLAADQLRRRGDAFIQPPVSRMRRHRQQQVNGKHRIPADP